MASRWNRAPLTAMYIGELATDEFSHAVRWLRKHTVASFFSSVDEAMHGLRDAAQTPIVCVLAQSRPGRFDVAEIARLRSAMPLTRFLHLLGGFCEGETRTGHPLPGAIRVYWHQWLPRLEAELERWNRDCCPSWGRAQTMTDDDRFLHAFNEPEELVAASVGVLSASISTAECIREALLRLGCRPATWNWDAAWDLADVGAIIWDDSAGTRRTRYSLRSTIRRVEPVPVLALLDFPRTPDAEAARAAGARVVLAKPFHVADLMWAVRKLVVESRPGGNTARTPAA